MDLNESNMWCLTSIILFTVLFILVTVLRFEHRRKRILANRIPGPDGSFLIGMLPLFLQGPEKIITHGVTFYRM